MLTRVLWALAFAICALVEAVAQWGKEHALRHVKGEAAPAPPREPGA